MGDITKIREWVDSDEPEPTEGWLWPAPPSCIESRISGELRARILRVLGQKDDGQDVTLVESEVEGGWSEFTPETTWEIEVFVAGHRVFSRNWDFAQENAMAAFLKWTESDRKPGN